MEQTDYLVVGGGLAGGYAAEAIRESDESGRVVLVTEEVHRPYDRVPLSKDYLRGHIQKQAIFIEDEDYYQDQRIELLTGRKAVGLDAQSSSLMLEDGSKISFQKLLLATGGRARRLPFGGSELRHVFYLRTIEDSEAIMKAMQQSERAVIIGGGFIGCELASTFRTKGLETTIIENTENILSRVLDKETASWIGEYFEAQGVRVMKNTIAKRFTISDGDIAHVETVSGDLISADFATVGIGIAPNVELANVAGLKIDNGILVNEHLETSIPGIYAAGDVANFYSPIFGRNLRLEHYDVAVNHGEIAGRNMAGGSQTFNILPYFFSYLFDLKLEVYGDMSQYDKVIRRGQLSSEGFIQFYLQNEAINAMMLVNRSEDLAAINRLVTSRRIIKDASILSNESVRLDEVAKEG